MDNKLDELGGFKMTKGLIDAMRPFLGKRERPAINCVQVFVKESTGQPGKFEWACLATDSYRMLVVFSVGDLAQVDQGQLGQMMRPDNLFCAVPGDWIRDKADVITMEPTTKDNATQKGYVAGKLGGAHRDAEVHGLPNLSSLWPVIPTPTMGNSGLYNVGDGQLAPMVVPIALNMAFLGDLATTSVALMGKPVTKTARNKAERERVERDAKAWQIIYAPTALKPVLFRPVSAFETMIPFDETKLASMTVSARALQMPVLIH